MKKLAAILIYIAGMAGIATASTPFLNVETGSEEVLTFDLSKTFTGVHHLSGALPSLSVSYGGGRSMQLPLASVEGCDIMHPEIPTLSFRLPDYPDATQVWTKDSYADATLDICGNGFCEDLADLSVTVKGRGNSTWHMPKKPIRLKFSKKTSICGFAKAKSYVLLANFLDDSHARNSVALWLAGKLDVPYANTTVPCNVFFNDNFLGLFLLTEKVGINSGSVDIDEEEGILFELSTEYDEPYKFRSELNNLPVMVKDPDFDELFDDDDSVTPEERLAFWQDDFNAAERTATEANPFDAFDLDSFVNYILLYNIVANHELSHPKSSYIFKEKAGEDNLYYFGPAWDFDAAFNLSVAEGSGFAQASPEIPLSLNPLYHRMALRPEFKERYAERFAYYYENVYPELMDFLSSYETVVTPSAELDGRRWPQTVSYGWCSRVPSGDMASAFRDLREWLEKRTEFLKERAEKGQL